MKWAAVLGITVLVLLMFLYEWPKMNVSKKKDKAAFVGLTILGWVLGIVLIFFPKLPSPTILMDNLFEPLGKMLEE